VVSAFHSPIHVDERQNYFKKVVSNMDYSLLKLSNSNLQIKKNFGRRNSASPNFKKGERAMESVAIQSPTTLSFTIACDERCAMVHKFSSLVKWWDRQNVFTFVDRDSRNPTAQRLVRDLDGSPWSLLLIDEDGERWSGPEAIPMILKHLPFGKLAAVLYILPGTMWITRQFYLFASRNRRLLTQQNA
jgi:predicted DCC family thiol-disulfide oxidoreductase YuxK